MLETDIPEVGDVEAKCFPNPWPVSAYRRELARPQVNFYIVLREEDHFEPEDSDDDLLEPRKHRPGKRFGFWPFGSREPQNSPIIGFAGMWSVLDEAHVTTIGVLPDRRGEGLGELLFLTMMLEALRRNVTWVTLEVRVSNTSAQNLYRKYGFTIQGTKPRYYSDNNEDAFVMWSESLKNEAYVARLEQLNRQLHRSMSFTPVRD